MIWTGILTDMREGMVFEVDDGMVDDVMVCDQVMGMGVEGNEVVSGGVVFDGVVGNGVLEGVVMGDRVDDGNEMVVVSVGDGGEFNKRVNGG